MILRIDQITHTGRQKVGGLATVPGGFPTVPGRLATDGARIYFSDIVEGHAAPMVVPAAGGEALQIPRPFKDATVLDITPDGSDLDVGAMTPPDFDYTLWRVSVLGGSPRRVGDLVVNDFGETPDGRGILFEKGSDIYFARADGTNARKLLSVSGWAFPPIYSPDEKRLRFGVHDTKQNRDAIWEALPDGSNLHRFRNAGGNECCGVWTPDGKYFVFQATVGGNTRGFPAHRARSRIAGDLRPRSEAAVMGETTSQCRVWT